MVPIRRIVLLLYAFIFSMTTMLTSVQTNATQWMYQRNSTSPRCPTTVPSTATQWVDQGSSISLWCPFKSLENVLPVWRLNGRIIFAYADGFQNDEDYHGEIENQNCSVLYINHFHDNNEGNYTCLVANKKRCEFVRYLRASTSKDWIDTIPNASQTPVSTEVSFRHIHLEINKKRISQDVVHFQNGTTLTMKCIATDSGANLSMTWTVEDRTHNNTAGNVSEIYLTFLLMENVTITCLTEDGSRNESLTVSIITTDGSTVAMDDNENGTTELWSSLAFPVLMLSIAITLTVLCFSLIYWKRRRSLTTIDQAEKPSEVLEGVGRSTETENERERRDGSETEEAPLGLIKLDHRRCLCVC